MEIGKRMRGACCVMRPACSWTPGEGLGNGGKSKGQVILEERASAKGLKERGDTCLLERSPRRRIPKGGGWIGEWLCTQQSPSAVAHRGGRKLTFCHHCPCSAPSPGF